MAGILDVTGWTPRQWDSSFFGVDIAQITGRTPSVEELMEAVAQADRASIDCLYFLVDAADRTSVRGAEAAGFSLVDIRLTLDCPADAAVDTESDSSRPVSRRITPGVLSGTAAVRLAQADDVPAVRELARISHRNTRFYQDARFARDRCDDLYALWVERSIAGELADAVWVVDVGGVAKGYLTIRAAQQCATIGLVAVAPACRGLGYGDALLRRSLTWAAARELPSVSVVTQGANVQAVRFYQRAGFRPSAMELWYHRWRPADVDDRR